MAAAATTAVTSLDLSGKKGEFQRSTAKWRHVIRATTDADGTHLCAKTTHFIVLFLYCKNPQPLTFPQLGMDDIICMWRMHVHGLIAR
jgi:hypothetical protein